MKTYYLALAVLWLFWECDFNFCATNSAAVNYDFSGIKTAPPPITPADTVTRIAAVPACPVYRPR